MLLPAHGLECFNLYSPGEIAEQMKLMGYLWSPANKLIEDQARQYSVFKFGGTQISSSATPSFVIVIVECFMPLIT